MMANTYPKSGKCGCGDGAPRSACKCGGGCAVCETSATGMVRPRFFAGQLLTEDDLQALTSYVGRKQQLHNRFLFGAGVVCGLEVSCNPCGGGQVTVKPGYALDCCGNDLVLDCATTLDLNGMIRDLRRDQLGGYDCGDPCADKAKATNTASNADQDSSTSRTENVSAGLSPVSVEQVAAPARHYCLYVRYNEQNSDPVSPYSTGADCGSQQCEPTRIREGVCFEIRCRDEKPAANLLLQRLCGCLGSLKTLAEIMIRIEFLNRPLPAPNPVEFNMAFDKVHQWLLERLDHSPDLTDCALRADARSIIRPILSQPTPAGTTATGERPGDKLVAVVRRYLRDCLCRVMTPPCAPCNDDGVLLACVEMSNCEVVKVCASKRQFVLSPSAVRYWLPPLQWLESALEQFCCGTFDAGLWTDGRLDFKKVANQQILQSLKASACEVDQNAQPKVDSSQLFSLLKQLIQTSAAVTTGVARAAAQAAQENVAGQPQADQLDADDQTEATPVEQEATGQEATGQEAIGQENPDGAANETAQETTDAATPKAAKASIKKATDKKATDKKTNDKKAGDKK